MFQGLIHEIKNSKNFHFMDGPSAINKKKIRKRFYSMQQSSSLRFLYFRIIFSILK